MAFVLPQQIPPQTFNHAQAQQQQEERALRLPWYRAAYLLCHYCDRELKRTTVLDAIQYICTEPMIINKIVYYKTYTKLWKKETTNLKQSYSAVATEVIALSSS
mmetsp:Transcript_12569/g.18805  ORF Transcript_12569/g.18805 Transcript_12569/m.18805 type:complete len:104 (-) Transcript_12569:235-546(-)